ncbi:gluconokinase [Pelagibacterium xiamenense]|uniref:gluconokinase n=1 Tax=Pelagibacterium xiamenense TaxID=2901140 RepID=UPI001E4DCCAD|nr:gluconokinase [Pelagibacterium xiamenense]MCD7059933.1 gluconokinase [Pelagibacterium xiamenense]
MPATDSALEAVRLIVVMGVSGAGKSTVGSALADKIGVSFIDADHLHPKANVEKMRGGKPLADEDRWPWLERVAQAMVNAADQNGRVVCACSSLRYAYRAFLRQKAGEAICFVLLNGDKSTIARRQADRPGHFMPAALLDSQFATLEPFQADECALTMDVEMELAEIVEKIAKSIG